MADRLFSTLEPRIASHASGCPIPTIIQHVRAIAIDVCENTLLWRYEAEPVVLTTSVYEYDFDLPHKTEVTAITHATINDVPVDRLTEDDIHIRFPDWPPTDSTKFGSPQAVSQIIPQSFVVAPVPDSATVYTVKMFLALKPTRDATAMDERIFNKAEQLILDGALSTLFAMPDKSWSSAERAAFYSKQYTYKTGKHRANTNIGVGRSALTVQMVPFG